ncbi:MAG: s-methyl-5-thioribose-1-phosphate isomerase [Candidatus Caldarchaeum sp.]
MELPILADRFKCVIYEKNELKLLDRRLYPHRTEYVVCRDVESVARAIEDMVVQGAAVIAYTAGYGLALAASMSKNMDREELRKILLKAGERLRMTRPTGAELFHVIESSLAVGLKSIDEGRDPANEISRHVHGLMVRGEEIARKTGEHASRLLDDGDKVLTNCYAGPALVYALLYAREKGLRVKAFVPETRPYLQGARLTAPTLKEAGIDTVLVPDPCVGQLIKRREVSKYITATDRVALDGSIANKVGTYLYAVVASKHDIPFYVLAYTGPDRKTYTYEDIVIEERPPKEVLTLAGMDTAPEGVKAYYPAFDIVPPKYIAGIITERGVFHPSEMKYYWG